VSSPGTRPRQAASDRGRSQQKRAAYPPSSGLLFLRSSPSGPLPRRFVARARPPRRVGEAPTRDRARACPDQRVGTHTQIFEEYRPDVTPEFVGPVVHEIDAVVLGARFAGWQTSREDDGTIKLRRSGGRRWHCRVCLSCRGRPALSGSRSSAGRAGARSRLPRPAGRCRRARAGRAGADGRHRRGRCAEALLESATDATAVFVRNVCGFFGTAGFAWVRHCPTTPKILFVACVGNEEASGCGSAGGSSRRIR